MCTGIGICTQCGAQGEIGTKCEYCGSTITAPQPQGNHSMIESWSDYHLDGFRIVSKNLEGSTDFPDFQVIEGDRTGKQGLVDRYGTVIIPCIYDFVKIYLDYNLCSVAKDYQHAILDTNGQTIVPFEGINPFGVFLISDGLIVGYNTVYDLQGNLKVKLATDTRVILLSNLYATTLDKRGLYSLESGDQLLSDDYKVDKIIDTHLIIVNKVFNGFTRYGIYDCSSREFALNTEYSSILEQGYKHYVARAQSAQDNGATKSKTLTLSIQDGKIVIEKENTQNYQSGTGCMILFVPLLLPLIYFLL